MRKYKNSDNSGIAMYEEVKDGIILMFQDGSKYLYTMIKPGQIHVKNMIELAVNGEGLATYINKYVRDNYYSKLN